MIKAFNTKYKACSNLFVQNIEGMDAVFPAPLELYATIDNSSSTDSNEKSEVKFKFASYYDSILPLQDHFSVFMYLLTFEYKIHTLIFGRLSKIEDQNEMNGYAGLYSFLPIDLSMNLGEEEVFDRYKEIEKKVKSWS